MAQGVPDRDPHWWAFGGGALVVALLSIANKFGNPPLSANPVWRVGMALAVIATFWGVAELSITQARHFVFWVCGKELPQVYLRPKAIQFGKNLRKFYEAGKDDPDMPTQFFIRYYSDICEFKDRFSAAIGPANVYFLGPGLEYIAKDLNHVEWVVFSVEREAAQVAHDILA